MRRGRSPTAGAALPLRCLSCALCPLCTRQRACGGGCCGVAAAESAPLPVSRRLSIISLPNDEAAPGRGADEKDTQGPAAGAERPSGDRRRRLSIVGLFTGEVIQAEEATEIVGEWTGHRVHVARGRRQLQGGGGWGGVSAAARRADKQRLACLAACLPARRQRCRRRPRCTGARRLGPALRLHVHCRLRALGAQEDEPGRVLRVRGVRESSPLPAAWTWPWPWPCFAPSRAELRSAPPCFRPP